MPENVKHETYYFFRYQLVPISKHIQITTDYEISSYEDLLQKKNIIFQRLLLSGKVKLKARSEALYKIIHSKDSELLLQVGSHKNIKRYNEEFNEEKIADYPNILVYINNDPASQLILVEENHRAFSSPNVVVSILEESLKNALRKYQLALYVKPIVEEREFWNTVKEYDERINQLSFELIKPNLSNISRTISSAIKSVQNNTNSHKTKLELNAPKKEVLENIEKTNEDINGLVKYANEGGGDIALKIKGYRRKIYVSENVQKEVTIDEMNIRSRNLDEIVSIFRQISGE